MTDPSDQLDIFEADETNPEARNTRTLHWSKPNCTLCKAPLQTLPPRQYRVNGILLYPCPRCDSALQEYARKLKAKKLHP